MKRIISLSLALFLVLAAFAFPAAAEEREIRIGLLSMLNCTEEQYASYEELRWKIGARMLKNGSAYGAFTNITVPENLEGLRFKTVFYESLDAMIMGLMAGEIDYMQVYKNVAEYLISRNDELEIKLGFDDMEGNGSIVSRLIIDSVSNDFSFLFSRESSALRDQFNDAIQFMHEDGTLQRLIDEQITATNQGQEIRNVEIPHIEGAETIHVAVTGALPPMDYVNESGVPCGFNTAVLAEISQRIGKNIEITVVDSIGRIMAMSTGVADAVFWTRINAGLEEIDAGMDEIEEVTDKLIQELQDQLTEEEVEFLLDLRQAVMEAGVLLRMTDVPDNTINTVSYFSDTLTLVGMKTH